VPGMYSSKVQRLVIICRFAAHELLVQDFSTGGSAESDFGPSTAW
jgi:hypothetical protein